MLVINISYIEYTHCFTKMAVMEIYKAATPIQSMNATKKQQNSHHLHM